MAEPVSTRKELRRAVCLRLQMPFFRRFSSNELSPDTTSSASLIKDADLTQKDGFWNTSWYYNVTSGEVSFIRSFERANTQFSLEKAIVASTNVEEPYEVHSVWNALEVHECLNTAIESVKRIFTDSVEDTSLILQQDKLTYTISGLTKLPFTVKKVWLENPGTIVRGTATAGAASTITVQEVPSDVTTNWKVSIYDGVGKGQIRNYASNSGLVITVNTVWTTNPDSTSKYAMWDATEELFDWVPLSSWYPDAPEFPDTISFRRRMTSYYGTRIKIKYESQLLPMSADTDSTIAPKEYIINKTCALLHGKRLGNTRADKKFHADEMAKYEAQAAEILRVSFPQSESQTMMSHEDSAYYSDLEDPLGWNG